MGNKIPQCWWITEREERALLIHPTPNEHLKRSTSTALSNQVFFVKARRECVLKRSLLNVSEHLKRIHDKALIKKTKVSPPTSIKQENLV